MQRCDIYYVKHDGTFRWKWRYVSDEGDTEESDREYALFYECVSAAREKGYEPKTKCL